jgi:Ca2+-binding RTX toxin-like protein
VAIGGGSTVTSATAIDGTSFLPSLYTSWLSSSGSGSYSEAYPEEIFQNFLSSGSIDFSYPTIILFMHNESDSTTSPGDLTASDFENAVAYEQSLVNSTAGTNIPYLYVSVVPSLGEGINAPDSQGAYQETDQNIRSGMQYLSHSNNNDSIQGGIVYAGDQNMDYAYQSTASGGGSQDTPDLHADSTDLSQLAARISEPLAAMFLQADGTSASSIGFDYTGPQVASATVQSSSPNRVLVTVSLATGSSSLASLSAAAANGAGWSFTDGNGNLVFAISAALVSSDQVQVTFADPLPTDKTNTIYYMYGTGGDPNNSSKIESMSASSGVDPLGQDNAIYDNSNAGGTSEGMPLFASANGVSASTSGATSSVSGDPGAETISAAANSSVTVTSGSNLVYASSSGPDFIYGGSGSMTVYGSSGAVTAYGGSGGYNLLEASSGNATLTGSGPNNTIIGGSGSNIITAGPNYDTVYSGSGGNNTVFGGSNGGEYTVIVGQGNTDLIVSGTGDTNTYAGSNDTTIYGGSASDFVTSSSSTGSYLSYVGGSGQLALNVGTSQTDIYSGTGTDYYYIVDGSAGGNLNVSGFKIGQDLINLHGYDGTVVSDAEAGRADFEGGTIFALPDNTHIFLAGLSSSSTGSGIFQTY